MEISAAYAEVSRWCPTNATKAIETQDYPAEHIPPLEKIRDTVFDMIAQSYYVNRDGKEFWPLDQRPRVPVAALGEFAPAAGDPEVLDISTTMVRRGMKKVQVIECLRHPDKVLLPWTRAPLEEKLTLPPPYDATQV